MNSNRKIELERKIQEIDSDLFLDVFKNGNRISLDAGQVSDAYRLVHDSFDVVVKISDKYNDSFFIEDYIFGDYKIKKDSSQAHHDFEQKKITDLYLAGFNVVTPVDSGHTGIVVTQYNPSPKFDNLVNLNSGDFPQILLNLKELHANGIYHGDPHLGNIFYDKKFTWFDFDTELHSDVSFEDACARDLRICLLSTLKKTKSPVLVKDCYNTYESKLVKDNLISQLDNMNEDYNYGYAKAGFGNPKFLKNILKGVK